MIVPVKTGDNTKKYPSDFIFSVPITAISAVAPPGGWSVRVVCITIMERATARGAVIQIISGKNLYTLTPIIAESNCPEKNCEVVLTDFE